MNGQKDIKEVVIPNDFIGIGSKPFSGFSLLTNIPKSMVKIFFLLLHRSIGVPNSIVYWRFCISLMYITYKHCNSKQYFKN